MQLTDTPPINTEQLPEEFFENSTRALSQETIKSFRIVDSNKISKLKAFLIRYLGLGKEEDTNLEPDRETIEKPKTETLNQQLIKDIRNDYAVEIEGIKNPIIPRIEFIEYDFNKTQTVSDMTSIFEKMQLEQGLETGTEATNEIESIIKETLKSFGKDELAEKLRVCILRRTSELNASCFPDATITITQELINQLGSLDLLMGVIFHEVTHYEENHFASDHNVVKESSADTTLTSAYLDRSGLNSLGCLRALGKLEEIQKSTGRSLYYLSLMKRRDIIRAQHKVYHFKHSSIPETPLSEALSQEATRSNIGILKDLMQSSYSYLDDNYIYNIGEINFAIENLSKSNLHEFYFKDGFKNRIPIEVFLSIKKTVSDRLIKEGYTDESEINYILTCLTGTYLESPQTDKSGDELFIYSLTDIIEYITFSKNLNKFNTDIFGELETREKKLILPHLLNYAFELVEKNYNISKEFSIISDDKVISFFEAYFENSKKLNDTYFNHDSYRVFKFYINYLLSKEGLTPDECTNLLLKLKNSKINFIFDDLSKNKFFLLPTEDLFYFSEEANFDQQEMNHFVLKNFLFNNGNLSGNNKIIFDSFIEVFGFREKELEDRSILETINSLFAELIRKDEYGNYLFSYESSLELEFRKVLDAVKREIEKTKFNSDEEKANKQSQIIYKLFEYIESLPLDDPNFICGTKNNTLQFTNNMLLHEYIKYGSTAGYENGSIAIPEFNSEYIERFRKYSLFFSKFNTLLQIYETDSPDFYKFMTDLMNNSGIEFENHTIYEQIRIIMPILSLSTSSNVRGAIPSIVNKYENYFSGKSVKITQLDKLEQLPFVSIFLESESPKCDGLTTITDYRNFIEEMLKNLHAPYRTDPDWVNTHAREIFNENLIYSKLFADFRKKYGEFLETVDITSENYLDFYYLTTMLHPESNEKKSILAGIRRIFLENELLSFDQKIDFFKQFYEEFSDEEVFKLVESIKSEDERPGSYWENWNKFLEVFVSIKEKLVENSSSIEKFNILDMFLESLTPKEILKSSIGNQIEGKKSTLDLALAWLRIASTIHFNEQTNKFSLNQNSRHLFQSLNDTIASLKGLSFNRRFYIVKNSLNGANGILRSGNSTELGNILKSIFSFNDPFLDNFILSACESSDYKSKDFLINTISFIIAKDLFKNLDLSLISIEELKTRFNNENTFRNGFLNASTSGKTTAQSLIDLDSKELRRILESHTSEIKTFGVQYSNPNSSTIFPLIQDIETDFQKVRDRLRRIAKLDIRTTSTERESRSPLPQNIEIAIKGLEQTILGTRSIQMANQLYNFSDPEIKRRFAESFDSAPGMNRLEFLLALTSTAEADENIRNFLENNLVDIVRASEKRDSLGGASMATVFKARILGSTSGLIEESAIRCLIPNAKQEIEEMYVAISSALLNTQTRQGGLDETLKEYQDRVRKAAVTLLITELSHKWCLDDINDPNYEINDDKFRETVLVKFLEANPEYDFVAPDRILTSKVKSKEGEQANWVRVEGFAPGISVRKFLEDTSIDTGLKTEVIMQIYKFNLFQYSQNPNENENVIVQSDPSIGNYNVEILPDGKPRIHILDRGFMLEMDKSRLELFRLFFDDPKDKPVEGLKKKLNFLRKLITEVKKSNYLEVGDFKINSTIITKLYGVVSKSKLFRNSVNMSDVILAINDAFTELGLKVPINIQLPIKNIMGWKKLISEYTIEE